MTKVPPMEAPYPVESYLKLDPKSASKRLLHSCRDGGETRCAIDVRVGVFFDGTNNNLQRDRQGVRIVLPEKSAPPHQLVRRPLHASEYSHSNVARLFLAYREVDSQLGCFSYYIPGVGTPFDEIGEPTETSDGKAFGKGGNARIIFALFQVINSIYRALINKPLINDLAAGRLAQNYDRIVSEYDRNQPSSNELVVFFSDHLNKLQQAIAANPKPAISSLTLDVFGFSRGAAQAVAFSHFFNDLLRANKFASIPASINFLGVFDTVASIGISASVSQTLPVPDRFANGHLSWARRILDPLPPCVRTGRHFVAAHEQRMNFPVTTLEGSSGFKEMYFPGVHSDVGGGYAPGESGKARRGQASLLSQIPLVFMYKEALVEGVALKDFDELESEVRDDFLIDHLLAVSWNAYRNALIEIGEDKADRLKQHMKLFYSWRARRLDTLHLTASFLAADKQAQQDLADSNRMLKGDLHVMRQRPMPRDESGNVQFSVEERKNISHWQQMHAGVPLDEWEEWAVQWFKQPHPFTDDVLTFFDDYVHDSIAGFYLAGEVTEYDRRVKAAAVMKMWPEKMNGFEKRIYQLTSRIKDAQNRKAKGESLSEEDAALVQEATHGTPFPIMTDADTTDMANKMIYTQTTTRREGGGYFLRRSHYPKEGFIFFPKTYIHEKRLDRAHISTPANRKLGKEEVYEAVWTTGIAGEVQRYAMRSSLNAGTEFA